MIIILQLLFWLCVVGVFHSYVLFPFILGQLAEGKKQNDIIFSNQSDLPHVHILFSVYNGERLIQQKMMSMLDCNYPSSKIHFWIGSDASTDKTNELLSSFASKFSNIHFYTLNKRQGKGPVINFLFEELDAKCKTDDVILLTDASVIFNANTILNMVKHFSNPEIGLVGANILNGSVLNDGISYQEKAYFEREITMKHQEGLVWGASMGAFGACYAIRKKLFSPIPNYFLVDDFYISMKVIEKGYKAIYEIDATCFLDVPNDTFTELNRKIRISAGNFQNLKVFSQLLFKWNGISFSFFSHKVLRWYTPFFILISFFSAFCLIQYHEFYRYIFAFQLLMFFTPLINYSFQKVGVHVKTLKFAAHFYSMNFGVLLGFIKYIKGVKSNTWQPTQR